MSDSAPNAALGSLGSVPLVPAPSLPPIIAEWAAILPLICHLANQRDDYITTGDVALKGKLSVGLFPRLGTLSGLSRLLERGTEYLDYASTKGGSSRTVWDVKWGSVFPCANGAAVHVLSKYLLSRSKEPPRRISEKTSIQVQRQQSEKSTGGLNSSYTSYYDGSIPKTGKGSIRRYQTLHVYQFYRNQKTRSWRRQAKDFFDSLPVQITQWLLLIGLSIFLGLFGCYGTCAIIACSTASEIIARNVKIPRSAGYLKNSEYHDACMLMAAHENATEWHLYIGDRAIVDTLLNKPMFVIPDGTTTKLTASWFWFAHLLQLAAMTFVAAQKGWDGTCLMLLLAGHWSLYFLHSGQGVAQDWLEKEGIEAKVKSFEFGGRFGLMGAIQLFSGSTTTRWMDAILVPHPRRELWLKRLQGSDGAGHIDVLEASWVQFSSDASFAGAEVLEAEFTTTHSKAGPA
ncbi:unnamed protein product [Clonostachys rosea]|uniref:Uncharacterized protein n=1 Tax=Bionectria ochroleuca TaxID=29856 RepID=A0ABY6TWX6_BIOOC|nr:unnamed protein product [Clonostachys rosea]